jgi:hypothetical protein
MEYDWRANRDRLIAHSEEHGITPSMSPDEVTHIRRLLIWRNLVEAGMASADAWTKASTTVDRSARA